MLDEVTDALYHARPFYLKYKFRTMSKRCELTGKDIQFGNNVSPDDCYLALRGMRTMAIRLRQHQETALKLIDWLIRRPEVNNILYPAWPHDPGHSIWKRDFNGASGLFGVVLNPVNKKSILSF